VTPPLPHDAAVAFADFSQDGQRVLTAQVNGTARVWEIATAQLAGPAIKSAGGGFAQTFSK